MFYFCFNYFVLWQASISKMYGMQVPTAHYPIRRKISIFIRPEEENGTSSLALQVLEECDSLDSFQMWCNEICIPLKLSSVPLGQLICHSVLNHQETHNVWVLVRSLFHLCVVCTAIPGNQTRLTKKDKNTHYVHCDELTGKFLSK